MSPGDVSVIIPTLNEADHVGAAIESAWNNGAGETIVCDGGSQDATVRLAQQKQAQVVHSRPGRGRQLAAGAKQAGGEVLLFLHADNQLGEDCLHQVCDLANRSAAAKSIWGGFRQQIDGRCCLYRALEWGNAARVRFRGMPFGDQAVFVTRTLYDRVGGFQALPLMEDVVLARSLRRECWPVLIDRFVQVDARRWQKRGILRQTIRNWGIQLAHRFGVSEERLANWYR